MLKNKAIWIWGMLLIAVLLAEYAGWNANSGNLALDKARSIELYPAYLAYTSGYDMNGNDFAPNNSDPQLDFILNGLKVAVVRLSFSTPLNQDVNVQIYYASENESLSEDKQVVADINKGSSNVIVELPTATYRELRVDVNGSFSLEQITISEDEPIWAKTRQDYLELLIMCAVTIFVFAVVWGLFRWLAGNEKRRAWPMLLIMIILLECALWGANEGEPVLNEAAPSVSLYPEDISYVVGYDREGSLFVQNNGDPQFGISRDNMTVRTVGCVFSEPALEDMHIQIYYARDGEALSESRSQHGKVNAGDTKVLIQIPKDIYREMRVDINGTFSLEKVVLSESGPVMAKTSWQYWELVLIYCITSLLFVPVCLFHAAKDGKARLRVRKWMRGREFVFPQEKPVYQGILCIAAVFFGGCVYSYWYEYVQYAQPYLPEVPAYLLLLTLYLLAFFEYRKEQCMAVVNGLFSGCMSVLIAMFPKFCSGIAFYYLTLATACLVIPAITLRETVRRALRKSLRRIASLHKVWAALLIALPGGSLIELLFVQFAWSDTAWRRSLFFSAVVFVILTTFLYRKALLQSPERMFLLLALTFGLYLAAGRQIVPESWDEEIHYYRTVFLSQGRDTQFAQSDLAIANRTTIGFIYGRNSMVGIGENIEMLDLLEGRHAYTLAHSDNAVDITRVGYLPAAFGIWVGNILKAPFHVMFILGRVMQLLAYVAVMYFAMRRLVNGKLILMVIALLPTNIFQATHYTYDAWVTAFTALGTAYLIGAMQRPGEYLRRWEAGVIIGSFVVAILPKAAYFPLTLLPLIMPTEKFKSKDDAKKYRAAASFAFFVATAVCVLPILKPDADITDERGGVEVNGGEQFKFVFRHPFKFASVLLRFLWNYISPENSQGYTSFLAYVGGTGAHTLPIALLWTASAVDCVREDMLSNKKRIRILSMLILFITLSVTASSLYIAFTAVGSDTIAGYQPRYILPVLFPFFILTCSVQKKWGGNREYCNLFFYLMTLYFLISTFWMTFVKLYTP